MQSNDKVIYELTKESSYCQVCGRTVKRGILIPEGISHLKCYDEILGKCGIGLNN